MTIGSAGFLVHAVLRGHRDSREEQQGFLTFVVPLVTAVACLPIAPGHGSVMLGGQEIFWARSADWSIRPPLLLLHFGVMLRIRPAMDASLIFADVAMIVMGLAGAGADHDMSVNYLWWVVSTGFFIAIIAIIAIIVPQFREYSRNGSQQRASVARNLMLLLLVLWGSARSSGCSVRPATRHSARRRRPGSTPSSIWSPRSAPASQLPSELHRCRSQSAPNTDPHHSLAAGVQSSRVWFGSVLLDRAQPRVIVTVCRRQDSPKPGSLLRVEPGQDGREVDVVPGAARLRFVEQLNLRLQVRDTGGVAAADLADRSRHPWVPVGLGSSSSSCGRQGASGVSRHQMSRDVSGSTSPTAWMILSNGSAATGRF